MTAWHREPMLAFDTETSGPIPDFARIVTATVIELGPDGIGATHQWLINPGVDIPQGAIDVHGVTNERARQHGVDPVTAVYELTGVLGLAMGRGIPVVAFNAAFDLTVLDRECRRHGIDPLNRRGDVAPVVDPHVIDKAVDTYRRGKRTLGVTCEHYGIDLGRAHDATADALGAARLAWKLAQAHPEQLQIPLEQLHAKQVGWRRSQAASLAGYFAKKGTPQDVCGDWPVQALPDAWDPAAHPVNDDIAGAA